ncbi:Deuterolysin metalloprotease family-domain-containing protein [Phaeosphaeriaceae sp. PMI808]|nr:Deuterolysin metalloprotease family-domain-containing protein [Phaeosphaeriaceae sp. PMI808]
MKVFGQLSIAALATYATAASIDVNKRDTPLSVKLAASGNSEVKVTLTNNGQKTLNLLSKGTFLDENNPVEKVSVYSAGGSTKVPFEGIKLRLLTSGLATEDFVTLKAGETKEITVETAALHSLNEGGNFDVFAKGVLPYAEEASTELSGTLDYESNKLTLSVDGTQAAAVAKAITKRTVVGSSCTGSKLSTVRTALSNCARFASAAASSASAGTKLNTYFKSTTSSTKNAVSGRLNAISRDCGGSASTTSTNCNDPFGGCSSNVLAYTVPSQNFITYCPIFFSQLPAVSSTCHGQDQATTVLHEEAHAPAVFSPGTDDLGYGFAAATRLSTSQALNNADSFALYANDHDLSISPVQIITKSVYCASLGMQHLVSSSGVPWAPNSQHDVNPASILQSNFNCQRTSLIPHLVMRRGPRNGSDTTSHILLEDRSCLDVEMLSMDESQDRQDTSMIIQKLHELEFRIRELKFREKWSPFPWRCFCVILLPPLALAPIIALSVAAEGASQSYIGGLDCYPNGLWKYAKGATWEIMDSSYFFTPNLSFGEMTFTQVKIIDVVWDLVIGRVGQVMLAWVNYRVFNEYIVWHMECYRTSFKFYSAVAFQTNTLGTLGVLVKEFLSFSKGKFWKSLLRWLAIVGMFLSTLYVLSFPTLMAAMTGYIAKGEPYVKDIDSNFIALNKMGEVLFVVNDAQRIGYEKPLVAVDRDLQLIAALKNCTYQSIPSRKNVD